jgi:hypothetical protein
MKATCTLSTGNIANFIVHNKTMPVVKVDYVIEKVVDKGSAKQNRTFHPLIDCFYSWMVENDTYQFEDNEIKYDFRCKDQEELKKIFKMRYGMGACSWEFVNDKNGMVKVYNQYEIPKYVVNDFNGGNHDRVKAVDAISWKEYNKDQRMNLISNTIVIMKRVGVDCKKFHEILDGIKDGS